MIEAAPRTWFSRTIEFCEDGKCIAVLERHRFLSGRIRVGDDVLSVRWRGMFRRSYVLESGGRLLAEATMTLFPARCEVMAGDRNLTLRAAGLGRREFRLLHGDLQIGVMRRRSLLSRSATVDFPAELSVPIRVFLAFLVYAYWRRRGRAAG